MELEAPAERLGDMLYRAAEKAPRRDFLVERTSAGLRRVTFGEALASAEAIASHLWDVHEGEEDPHPILALSRNSTDHALLMLGCFIAGIPLASVSAAYSLASTDFGRLVHIHEKLQPKVVFVEEEGPFARALGAIGANGRVLTAARLQEIARGPRRADLAPRAARVSPDHVAKVLFTSGSTGTPKGVPNTHRMLCANQRMIEKLWPFLDEEPPVFVDWLPWSHTFGANHNFNMALHHAGTFFIDEGKPTEALFERTVANLREVSPTLYFNVPAGFAALTPRLESDASLARAFFAKLRVVFYAGAALSDDLFQRLRRLAAAHAPHEVFMTTAWGSTETSPLAASAHFDLERAGNIGLPAPGVTLKLVPNGAKLEVRVRGPNVMSGYWDEPELTKAAFDEEGFYRIGDAVRFADPDDPSRGLLFDGRVAEDFKLATGTWVNASAVRAGVLAASAPWLADLVVAGHDRDHIAILAWPRATSVLSDEAARAEIAAAIRSWNGAHPGTSTTVARVLLLTEPPSIDAGEITDKGYVNQRRVLETRADDVERLFGAAPERARIDLLPLGS